MNTPNAPSRIPSIFAWVVVLLVSLLPTVVVQELFGQSVPTIWRHSFSLGIIVVNVLLAVFWKPLCSLLPFLLLFAVFIGARWLVYEWIDTLGTYPAWLGNGSFNVYMLAEQSLNVLVTLLMIGALLLMGKKPRQFYLVPGDLAAPAQPIRWLGVRAGTPWSRFGIWLAVCLSLGTLTFLVIAGRPPLDIIIRALPFLPIVLLTAALNAFTEEVSYKASFLSVMEGPVGPRQALYMVAVHFGIAHFYGVPYGIIGVLLAMFLGWILARSMQETHGLFWAWFIHFWQDVWIFSFLAIGSITPGC